MPASLQFHTVLASTESDSQCYMKEDLDQMNALTLKSIDSPEHPLGAIEDHASVIPDWSAQSLETVVPCCEPVLGWRAVLFHVRDACFVAQTPNSVLPQRRLLGLVHNGGIMGGCATEAISQSDISG